MSRRSEPAKQFGLGTHELLVRQDPFLVEAGEFAEAVRQTRRGV